MVFQAILSFLVVAGFVASRLTTDNGTEAQHRVSVLKKYAAVKPPICGLGDDGKIHIPPEWDTFTPPPVGRSYLDPVFGCAVTRVTDGSVEETLPDRKQLSFMHEYSTLSPMNATDTMLLITSDTGAWRIKDTTGHVVVSSTEMPKMNNGILLWDASDGKTFFYTFGKSLYRAEITSHSVKSAPLHTFKEYRGMTSPATADLSEDGDHIALIGQNGDDTMDIFVWSLSNQTKTSTYTTKCTIKGDITETPEPGCVHKLLITANNLLAIAFADNGAGSEEGARLWDGKGLVHLQDRTNHMDTGYDLDGKPVFIGTGNSYVLAGEKNPCVSGWGLDVRQLNETSSAVCLLDRQPDLHVSYRGSASQPWVAISFFDERKPGPELFGNNPNTQTPSSKNWKLYEDEIILARIDGGGVYRLAHARSRSAENYWAQPHAAISRDGKYVVFTSNMAYPKGCSERMRTPDECTDVYFIRVQ